MQSVTTGLAWKMRHDRESSQRSIEYVDDYRSPNSLRLIVIGASK